MQGRTCAMLRPYPALRFTSILREWRVNIRNCYLEPAWVAITQISWSLGASQSASLAILAAQTGDPDLALHAREVSRGHRPSRLVVTLVDLERRGFDDIGQADLGQVKPEPVLRCRPEKVQCTSVDIAAGDSVEVAETGINGPLAGLGNHPHIDLTRRATKLVAASGARDRGDQPRSAECLHQAMNDGRADAGQLTDRIGTRMTPFARRQAHQNSDRLVQTTCWHKFHKGNSSQTIQYQATNGLAISKRLTIVNRLESKVRSPYQSDAETWSACFSYRRRTVFPVMAESVSASVAAAGCQRSWANSFLRPSFTWSSLLIRNRQICSWTNGVTRDCVTLRPYATSAVTGDSVNQVSCFQRHRARNGNP